MASADAVEAVLTEIGFGRWQGLVMVVALLFHGITVVQQIGSTMLSAPVPFRCSYPDGFTIANNTSIDSIAIPSEENLEKFPSKCLQAMNFSESWKILEKPEVSKMSINKHSTGLPSCPFIEYDTSTFTSTVISEWDLVCERTSLRPLFQMTYSIGAILGSVFCGQLSDWLGRKKVIMTGTIMATTTVILTSIVPWYSVMIIVRILTGTATMLILFPIYTLISEVSPSSYRTISAIIPGMMYFACMSAFSGIAYILPQWRMLLLVCNSPLLLMVPLTFFIDESPRWLLQKGRTTEASDLLKKAAKKNGATLSDTSTSFLNGLSKMSDDIAKEKYGEGNGDVDTQGNLQLLAACFSSPGMRRVLIITPAMWFLKRCLYIGIVLNANNFTSSSPFEYIIYSGIMGLVGLIVSIPLSHWLSRRMYIGGGLCASGALLLLEMFVPSEYWLVKIILVMTSFCLVCGVFQVYYSFAAELFPTVIRTRCFTFSNFVGSIGEMGIPMVTDIAVQYQWWAPSVTFGIAGIVSGLMIPFLPETKARPMPETLQDVEDRFWNDYKGHGKDETATNEVVTVVVNAGTLP